MMLYLSAFLAAVAAVNWIVNPYGAWPVSLIDPIYRKGGEQRVATPYQLYAEQPTTLLVGSSRVMLGLKIEQGMRAGVLNAGLPAANVDEVAAVIEVALKNPKLKLIVWGLDFFAFDQNKAGVLDPDTRLRLEGSQRLRIMDTLLSMDALDLSRRLLVRAAQGRRKLAASRLMRIPWPQAAIRREIDNPGGKSLYNADRSIIERQVAYWVPVYSNFRLSDRQLALFETTVARARQAGVEVSFFIPPLSGYELEALRQSGQWDTFKRLKRRIVAAGPYWDFSGYNEIARNEDLFMDVPHYKPAVGFTMLRRLLGEDCSQCGQKARLVLDSGLWVEPATVERVLAIQDERRVVYLQRDSRWSQIVEDLRRRSVSASATAKAHRNEPASVSDRTGSRMPAILRGR